MSNSTSSIDNDMRKLFYRERLILLSLLIITAVVWWQVWQVLQRDLSVTFVDVGQGDCIIIHAPNGRSILIDGGGRRGQYSSSDNIGRWMVVPALYREGIRHLDAIIVTHPDADHVGGLTEVIEQIPTDMMLTNGAENSSDLYERLLETARQHNIKLIPAQAGQAFNIAPGIRAEILHPPAAGLIDSENDENNNSTVVRLSYDEIDFLLVGDLQFEGEATLISEYPDIASEVLKVGHHGSMDSTSQEFITEIHPDWAIISVGDANPYGHPHEEALKRIKPEVKKVFRTDRNGSIIMYTDGRELKAKWKETGRWRHAELVPGQ